MREEARKGVWRRDCEFVGHGKQVERAERVLEAFDELIERDERGGRVQQRLPRRSFALDRSLPYVATAADGVNDSLDDCLSQVNALLHAALARGWCIPRLCLLPLVALVALFARTPIPRLLPVRSHVCARQTLADHVARAEDMFHGIRGQQPSFIPTSSLLSSPSDSLLLSPLALLEIAIMFRGWTPRSSNADDESTPQVTYSDIEHKLNNLGKRLWPAGDSPNEKAERRLMDWDLLRKNVYSRVCSRTGQEGRRVILDELNRLLKAAGRDVTYANLVRRRCVRAHDSTATDPVLPHLSRNSRLSSATLRQRAKRPAAITKSAKYSSSPTALSSASSIQSATSCMRTWTTRTMPRLKRRCARSG